MSGYLVGLLAAIAAALYGLHRLASWAEDRGWIYYRKGRGRSGTLSGAMLEAQSLLQPSAHHVVEERRRAETARDESGMRASTEGRGADRADYQKR